VRPISRRDALLLGGLGTAATVAGGAGLWWSLASPQQPTGGPFPAQGSALRSPPELRSADGTLQLTLDAAPGEVELGGRPAGVLSYNGTVPGPTIVARAVVLERGLRAERTRKVQAMPPSAAVAPFERVRLATNERAIDYPVALDNEYGIWTAFDNHYWPALYFVDADGTIRDHHFGEGRYEKSEREIQRLLGVERELVSVEGVGVEAEADWQHLRTPESYLGYDRAEHFDSPGGAAYGTHAYELPERLRLNHWALSGEWTVKTEAAVLNAAGGRIAYRFHARDLHLVMGPARRRGAIPFRVSIDGQWPGGNHGVDVDDRGEGTVTESEELF